MKQELFKKKGINNHLTQIIINCHEKGYTEDFFYKGPSIGVCEQNLPEVAYALFTANVIDKVYDSLTGGYKYIYTIVTSCGKKGLLLSPLLEINY